MPRFMLYTRPGCHLCENAAAVLARIGCAFDEINIEDHATLLLRYDFVVPVLAVDGRELLSGSFDERAARRALQRFTRGA